MIESLTRRHPALPYVLPMAGFLLLTSAESLLPSEGGRSSPAWYPLLYAAKVVVVALLAWISRGAWKDLRPLPDARSLALAAVLGLLVALVWVGLDGLYPDLPMLGKRTGFDPNVLGPSARWAFLAVRLLGLVLLVPLVEELFWRSFLMRLVIDAEFVNVPVGKVTPMGAAVTSILFGLAHPEWLPGVLTGFAWAWLLQRTQRLSACLVSHAAANLALGVYVIATGAWKFL